MLKVTSPLRISVNRKTKFTLNLNIYRNFNKFSLGTAKIQYKKFILKQLQDNLPASLEYPVAMQYTLFPKTKRLTDLGNVCSIHQKFLEDALVEYGYLPEDNYTIIPLVVFKFGQVTPENPRVEIFIEENYNANSA